ncbi:MAG: ATP-binding cassette domain-containing protein, partial [Pyrinomonadaceae bacterium]
MLKVENVSKEYQTPRGPLKIVSEVSLSLSRGDAVSIMGPSGSGKSTLLYLMGALEPPSSGTITLDDQNPFQLKEKELAAFRNKEIGFIFQDHCLLPQCSVLENVLTPTLVSASR